MTGFSGDSVGVAALLRDATRRFDASSELQSAAKQSARRGFRGGAEWMAAALSEIRGTRVVGPPTGALKAGLVKYGAATAVATTVFVIVGIGVGVLASLPLAILAFYATEAVGAFVFPALAAGARSPWQESLSLVSSAGGTVRVASKTMVIASVMLFGGLTGRGFLRSWCIGCLAMVLWYERLRA